MSEGSLSALAVSDSGDFVATGSMFDGTVEIYIAYNLRVRKPKTCSGKYIEIIPSYNETCVVFMKILFSEIKKSRKFAQYIHYWTRISTYHRRI